jgi:hypothetical protein
MQGWRGRAQTRYQRQDQKVRAGRLERERGCARAIGPPVGEVDALLHQVCLFDELGAWNIQNMVKLLNTYKTRFLTIAF